MPLPPYPVAPAPRTWAAGDLITTGRLRADMGNAALLLANRPLFIGQQTTTGQSIPSGTTTPVEIDTELLDSWGGHQIPNTEYYAPLSGWYLCSGNLFLPIGPGVIAAAGIRRSQNGAVNSIDGAKITASGGSDASPTCCDLVQLIHEQGDYASLYAFHNEGAALSIGTGSFGANFQAEWIGLPASANGYSGPLQLGTVLGSPPSPMPAPPGAGTTITTPGGIPAGASSVDVAAATGLLVGSTLGLDPAGPTAEDVTITSIAGTTIGITPCAYPHAQNAAVATPLGQAWLNSQVRDMVNFLAYPPMLRATYVASGLSLPSQAWPSGTLVPLNSANAIDQNVDNYSGFSASTGEYTFPVSGVWDCYGQVYTAGSSSNMSLCAGLSVNGGQIDWGDTGLNATASSTQTQCATVRRTLRVTAGSTIGLYGSQSSGSSLYYIGSAGRFCMMICVWRGF
ncbi:MAG: hypothetical protein M0030_07740 [Actinomycetota bacterium]|nr:hypothetical protein [Actinomycetota bacterium]